MGLALHPVLTILIALAPAAFSMWRGRAILKRLDDPALPERLVADQRRNAPIVAISTAALIVTSPGRFVWALPLMLFAKMLARYPLRKALHNETWSLPGYLSFFLRLIVAVFGFWLFVAALPVVVALAGDRDWIVAIILGTIAVAWNARHAAVFRAVLRTRPVDAAAICARFSQLTKECALPAVKLDQVDLRGGVFANAVALPSLSAPAVVVTDTLMDRLDENEVTAILAHEVAHLEHFSRPRLMQANIAAWILIAAAVSMSPVMRLAATGVSSLALYVWPVVLMGALMLRLKHQQKHETASDLRAVALTGDPEALVRALTKLHAFARVPRRWEAEFEKHATHPSLARRIQAIRHASGAPAESIKEPATFIGEGTDASVTFREDHMEWHEGSTMTHAVSYQQLNELRLDVRSSPAPRLVAVDSGARRWTIPLQAGDIGRAQAMLDVVDVRLGKTRQPSFVFPGAIRLLIFVLVVAGGAVGQTSIFVTGLMAMVQPTSQVAAAAGVSAFAASGLAWRDQALWYGGDLSLWVAATLALCGAALVVMAWTSRTNPPHPTQTTLLALLGISASLIWIIVAASSGTAFNIHRNIRDWPSVTVLTFACAGALAFARSCQVRWTSLPVGLIGLLAGYVGSAGFVDRFVNDPFMVSAPAIAVRTLATSPMTEFSVDLQPTLLRVSPGGHFLALSTEDADEQTTIHAGRSGGSLAPFTADEALFVSEDRLLLHKREPQGSVLSVIDLAQDDREVWSLNVPVRWADLSIDRRSGRWRLLGWNASRDIISAEGHLGENAIQQSLWKSPAGAHDLDALVVSRGAVIALETRHDYSFADRMRLMPSMPFLWAMPRAESRLWSLTEQGASMFTTSSAELTCRTSATIDNPSTCAAFDGARTRFFAVNAQTPWLTARASVAGRMYISDINDRDWLVGWWGSAPTALHAATGHAIQLPGQSHERPYQVAIGSTVIAGIFSNGRTSSVRIYPLTD